MTRARFIAMCATGKTGLGHLRRLTNIAREIKSLDSAADLCLLTNAEVAGISDEERALFGRVDVVERDAMAEALSRLPLRAVVVDTAVIPGLEAVDAPICLILRETVPDRLPRFRLNGARQWDRVILPNPTADWSVDPQSVRAKGISPVGWIYRQASGRLQDTRRREHAPTLLVAAGGGGTAATATAFRSEMDSLIAEARRLSRVNVNVVQCLGPRAPVEMRLSQATDFLSPGPDLNERFTNADVVISTAGYNSVLELALTDVPVLLVPIQRSIDDQEKRARRWGPTLGRYHDAASMEDSARWLAAQFESRKRRAPAALGASGAAEAARHILELG